VHFGRTPDPGYSPFLRKGAMLKLFGKRHILYLSLKICMPVHNEGFVGIAQSPLLFLLSSCLIPVRILQATPTGEGWVTAVSAL
jgi:hypothetical protein